MKPIDISKLNEALMLINEHLILDDAPATEIVVCGGSALIATGLVSRTTQDVDIVALMKAEVLVDSEPLPEYLIEAADRVGKILNLPVDWLNNGPALQFQMGLPQGFQERLTTGNRGPIFTFTKALIRFYQFCCRYCTVAVGNDSMVNKVAK